MGDTGLHRKFSVYSKEFVQHFLIGKSYVEYKKVFNCVLTPRDFCVSLFHGFVLVEKVTFKTRMCFNKVIKKIDIIL